MAILGVKSLKKAKTKRGTDYYSFRGFEDGRAVDCKIWRILGNLVDGDIIECDYEEDHYNGVKQYKVNGYSVVECDDQAKAEIFGIEIIDTESEVKDIEAYCKKNLKNEKYMSLLNTTIFKDGCIHEEFKTSTAAKGKHHDYDGGLCHHTYCMFKICISFSNVYDLDKDLIITGALLHDVGKIFTYKKIDNGAYDLSDNGHFFEHLTYGAMKVKDWWINLGYDEEDIDLKLLMHCILSHHGQKEWASPVEPVTQEAQLIHIADLADSRVEMMKVGVNEYSGKEYFTDRVYPMGVSLFDRKAFDKVKGECNE